MSANGVDEAPLYIFSPYPGTEIFKQLENENKISLDDDYFLALGALNSSYLSTQIVCFNPKINARLLGLLRTFFMLANYSVSYFFFPKRIFRSLKNIFSTHEAVTVFEHRLKDLIQRKRMA
jgi:hypothetical protein